MRSRIARLTLSVLAIAALGGAAFYIQQTSRQVDARTAAFRQFEGRTHEAVTSIGGARAAQRGYVASGQSNSVWMPQVKGLTNQAAAAIDALRGLTVTAEARQLLLDASASLTEFVSIDKQAHDYLAADQTLMASDVIFSAAGETAADIEHQLEAAHVAEAQVFTREMDDLRRRELYAGAGAAGFAGLVLLALGVAGRDAAQAGDIEDVPSAPGSLQIQPPPAPAAPATTPDPVSPVDEGPLRDIVALNTVAAVSTTFGRVQDVPSLKRALAEAAAALDASGLVVWLGNTDGADLQAVVAHGYSDHVLSMMRPVAKHADNAAATAYRTAALQIVPAKPGTSLGAVVAPILAAEGCIGALSAEIRHDGEVSDAVHAMAAIFASQLSGILAASAAQPQSSTSRAASA